MQFDNVSNQAIGCALEVHRHLGPGLLESTYKHCLARELSLKGVEFKTEAPLPVEYKGMMLDCGYRIDMLVESQLIVELKAVEKILGVHEAQLLTYMKLARISVGLLINFNAPRLKEGLRRYVL